MECILGQGEIMLENNCGKQINVLVCGRAGQGPLCVPV